MARPKKENLNNKSFYRGNPNLKSENVDIDYTDNQIKEISKCASDKSYFIKTYVKIITPKGLEYFGLRPYQQRMIDNVDASNRVIIISGRQSGKTVSIAAYIAHFIIFNQYKTAAILANKESTSIEILTRIKRIIEHLPFWMKPGIVEWNKKSVEFDNGCTIITGATSETSISGRSVHLLYIDEMALIHKKRAEAFLDSVLPVVSADPDAKIVCSSTPKGLNFFYKMYREAQVGRNGYSAVKVEWWEVPGRDDAWRKKIIAEKGEKHFLQEYSCTFLGSSDTLLDASDLTRLTYEHPIALEMDGMLKIYKEPEEEHEYIAIVDVSEGLELDDSTIQVIDVTNGSYEQVAVYMDNNIKPEYYGEIIAQVGTRYNKALLIVESNSVGHTVITDLRFNQEYDRIFYYDKFGLKMDKSTKKSGCGHLKDMIHNDTLKIVDSETVSQFNTFTRKGASYAAQDSGDKDDLITPLILFAYFMNKKEFTDIWLTPLTEINTNDPKESLVGMFFSNGLEDREEFITDYR